MSINREQRRTGIILGGHAEAKAVIRRRLEVGIGDQGKRIKR